MKDYVIEVDNRIAAAVILACVAAVTAASLYVWLAGQHLWF